MAKSQKKASAVEAVESGWGSWLKLLAYSAGIMVFFVAYGKTLEQIKSKDGFGEEKERFTNTDFLVVAQSLGNALFAGSILLISSPGKSEDGKSKSLLTKFTAGVPASKWLVISLAYAGAHKFGLGALAYISYPLQVLTKCCKPIPVMLGETLVAGKKHSTEKIVSVFILTAGIAAFMMFQPSKKANSGGAMFEWTEECAIGLGLVFLALVCDGIYGPGQNKIKQEHPDLTAYHNMLAMNTIQGLMTAVSMFSTTDVQATISLCQKHPELQMLIMQMAGGMALGSICIYKLQNDFGSLTVTTVTTLRKLVSIIFSIVFFGHSIETPQIAAIVVVVFSKNIAQLVTSQPTKPKKA